MPTQARTIHTLQVLKLHLLNEADLRWLKKLLSPELKDQLLRIQFSGFDRGTLNYPRSGLQKINRFVLEDRSASSEASGGKWPDMCA